MRCLTLWRPSPVSQQAWQWWGSTQLWPTPGSLSDRCCHRPEISNRETQIFHSTLFLSPEKVIRILGYIRSARIEFGKIATKYFNEEEKYCFSFTLWKSFPSEIVPWMNHRVGELPQQICPSSLSPLQCPGPWAPEAWCDYSGLANEKVEAKYNVECCHLSPCLQLSVSVFRHYQSGISSVSMSPDGRYFLCNNKPSDTSMLLLPARHNDLLIASLEVKLVNVSCPLAPSINPLQLGRGAKHLTFAWKYEMEHKYLTEHRASGRSVTSLEYEQLLTPCL